MLELNNLLVRCPLILFPPVVQQRLNLCIALMAIETHVPKEGVHGRPVLGCNYPPKYQNIRAPGTSITLVKEVISQTLNSSLSRAVTSFCLLR